MPFLVAESPSGQILGYALVQPWKSKSAYRYTVEDSIYLGQAAAGKGLGSALLEALLEACRDAGIDRKSGVEGKSGSVRLDLGGRRILKKKMKMYAYMITT